MHNLRTIHCPLPSDYTPKSVWRSFLSRLVNIDSGQHLATALKLTPQHLKVCENCLAMLDINFFLSPHSIWSCDKTQSLVFPKKY